MEIKKRWEKQTRKLKTYRFFNGAKLFKLLAQSGLFSVPCEAATNAHVSRAVDAGRDGGYEVMRTR
jgi:hypothetical protein